MPAMALFRKMLVLSAAAMILAACGTISREPFTNADLRSVQAPTGLEGLRFNGNDTAAGLAFVDRFRAQSSQRFLHGVKALAISGGGANGAYGAGVIVGWTQSGSRPDFDVVTGVSTGALTAPFAFLGPKWDHKLEAAYTNGEAANLTSGRLGALFLPSLLRVQPLKHLVEKYVDAQLLRAVAAEHRKGRRLLVATTNLDTEETVIWDMGEIAISAERPGNEDAAVELFSTVLVASASIPGVFPPAVIPVQGAGRAVSEMHVDGGVTVPFFFIPESMNLWRAPDRMRPGELYVVVNGKVGPTFGFTKGKTMAILGRSYNAMSRSQTKANLLVAQGFADRNNATLRYTAIPDDAEASSLDFSTENMRDLFQRGFEAGRSGHAFRPLEAPPPATPGPAPDPR